MGEEKKIGVVIFDMDSTLIQCESIEELAKRAGVYEQVMRITEEAMEGKLDFKESMSSRLAMLSGLSRAAVDEAASVLPITEGAKAVISWLQNQGAEVGLVSGGFTLFAEPLAHQLGLDFFVCNELEFADEMLTGRVCGTFIDGEAKARILGERKAQLTDPTKLSVAVGDGANDIPMLKTADIGVSFCGKPIVVEVADYTIDEPDLMPLIAILKAHTSCI